MIAASVKTVHLWSGLCLIQLISPWLAMSLVIASKDRSR
jgi:hypothetical protein